MRYTVIWSFLLLMLLPTTSCDTTSKAVIVQSNEVLASKQFSIQFVQKGRIIPLKHRQVRLRKAPFTIQVEAIDLPGVFVVSDFELHDRFLRDNEFDNLQTIAPKTMAEQTFNKNNELIINAQRYGYWFYNPTLDWHRYNVVQPKKDIKGFIGTKKVEQFYIKDLEKTISIDEAPDDLYLFFFSMEGSFELGHRVIQREYIKVSFE